MLKSISFLVFILLSFNIFCQDKSFADYEKELNQLSIDIVSEANDETKQKVNNEFQLLLKEVLEKKGSFDFPFKNIRAISILKSNDYLKIYNWALPFEDETYQYFAFLQIKTGKDEFKIVELIDKSADLKKPETQTLTDKTWYGALYYEIIYDKKLGNDTYTLLGWDGDYNLTNKKIIDVMTVSKNGAVKFGSSILKMDKKTQKRVIFTYSESTSMSLKYNAKESSIVFDYLVPPESSLIGIYEYYGPALLRVDSFKSEKGKWVFTPNFDAKLDKDSKDKIWTNPRGN